MKNPIYFTCLTVFLTSCTGSAVGVVSRKSSEQENYKTESKLSHFIRQLKLTAINIYKRFIHFMHDYR